MNEITGTEVRPSNGRGYWVGLFGPYATHAEATAERDVIAPGMADVHVRYVDDTGYYATPFAPAWHDYRRSMFTIADLAEIHYVEPHEIANVLHFDMAMPEYSADSKVALTYVERVALAEHLSDYAY